MNAARYAAVSIEHIDHSPNNQRRKPTETDAAVNEIDHV